MATISLNWLSLLLERFNLPSAQHWFGNWWSSESNLRWLNPVKTFSSFLVFSCLVLNIHRVFDQGRNYDRNKVSQHLDFIASRFFRYIWSFYNIVCERVNQEKDIISMYLYTKKSPPPSRENFAENQCSEWMTKTKMTHLCFIFLFDFFFFFFFFFYLGFISGTFTNYLTAREGEGISLIPQCYFHLLLRQLDISRAITAESTPLHIASSRTQTVNLGFPRASLLV